MKLDEGIATRTHVPAKDDPKALRAYLARVGPMHDAIAQRDDLAAAVRWAKERVVPADDERAFADPLDTWANLHRSAKLAAPDHPAVKHATLDDAEAEVAALSPAVEDLVAKHDPWDGFDVEECDDGVIIAGRYHGFAYPTQAQVAERYGRDVIPVAVDDLVACWRFV
jgi:hypothetical protein